MITMQVRSSDSQLTVMREAAREGHAEVAMMILTGAVRVYTRSPRSRPGWQISNWERPFPDGTAGVVYLDTYDGTPRFFILTARKARDVIAALVEPDRVRPENPESRHCYIRRELLTDFEGKWEFYRRAAGQ